MTSDQPLDRPNQFIFHWEHIFTALFLSGVVAAIASMLASLKPQRYSQLIAGNLAWRLGSKQPDYILLFSFVISFFLIYGGLYALAFYVLKANGAVAERSLRQLLIYSLLPFGILLGGVLVDPNKIVLETALEVVILSLLFVLLTIGFAIALAVKRVQNLSDQDYLNWVGGSLLYLLFASLVGSALTLFVGRVNLDWQLEKSGQVAIVSGIGFALLGWSLAKIWWQWSAKPMVFFSRLRFLLWAVQGFFPLFFFILVPTPWSANDGKYYGQPITLPLLVLLSGLVAATYVDWFLRFKKSVRIPDVASIFSVVSPLGLIALLLFVKSQAIEVNAIPADDYHWGEFLLPWWLFQSFHYIPFWDYEPARGLINYVPGFLANLFFGNSAFFGAAFSWTTGIYANPFLLLPYLSLGFLVVSQTIGTLPAFLAFLLMTSSNGVSEIDTVVTVCLCLWGNLFLKRQWSRWLAIWAVTGIAFLLFAPGQAGLLLLSTSPLAAFALVQAIRKERRSLISLTCGGSFLLGLLLWLTPLGKMLFGALRYAIEQSSINSIAYGIRWASSRDTNPNLSYSLWEVMRTSWILVGLVAGLLLFRAIVDKTWAVRGRYAIFAIPIVLLTVLFIPRAAGRIDPGAFSRLGIASTWSICLLLPISLITALEPHRKALSLMVVAVLGGMLVGLPSPEPLMSRPVQAIDISSVALMDGSQVGFPMMGEHIIIYSSKQLKRLRQIKRVLQAALNPGETYLDLTNHGADYFYLGYPPPIQAGAAYNLPHRNQQLRAVASLDATPPPISLIVADNILHDGGTLALRSHLLYRYVVAHYVPVKIEGLIYGVHPDRLERLQSLLAPLSINEVRVPSVELDLLDQAFLTQNLQRLPRSWGQSFDSLKSELQPVQEISDAAVPVLHSVEKTGKTYRVTGRDPHIDFDVSSLKLNGQDAGILTFDFLSDGQSAAPTLKFYWSSESGGNLSKEAVVRFSAKQGKVIVPLDAAPRWLLAKGIQTIRFEAADPVPLTFSLSHIELFQRSELPKGL